MLYGDALQEVVDSLNAVGLRATTEPSKVQLPGILVLPGEMTFDLLSLEDYSAVIDIYILTSHKKSVGAMNDLQEMLELVRRVYAVPNALPISVPLKNVAGNDPVPGLLINLQATITKD